MADPKKLDFTDMINQGRKLGEDINAHADTVKAAADTVRKIRGGKDSVSIIARARNSVLQFPVYITNSGIRVNEAHLIAKFLERMYASYVQQVLAQTPIKSEADLENMAFLRDIHVNFKESTYTPNKYYTPIDEIDKMLMESKYNKMNLGNGCIVEFKHVEITDPYYVAECKRLMHEPLEGFKFEKYKKLGIGGGTYNSEDEKDDEEEEQEDTKKDDKKEDKKEEKKTEEKKTEKEKAENTPKAKSDAEKDKMADKAYNRLISAMSKDKPEEPKKKNSDFNRTSEKEEKTRIPEKEYSTNQLIEIATGNSKSDDDNKISDDEQNSLKDLKSKVKRAVDGHEVEIKGKKVKIFHRKDKNGNDVFFTPGKEVKSSASNTNFSSRDRSVALPEILKDVEIKKINGMLPYAIKCSFRVAGTNHMADIDYLIGVKTVMHLVSMKALANDLPSIIEGTLGSIRKIRYKMGELSWLDYMFDLKGVKKDAAKRLNNDSKWLSTLKRLANARKANGDIARELAEIIDDENGIPLPNASLIISKNEVDDIKDKTGIDLTDTKIVGKLMDKIFLLCFMIVDGSAGTMKVLMEGQTSWDVQALAQLDAEKNRLDSSAVMQELGKMVYSSRR